MPEPGIRRGAIVVDGLIISKLSRSGFEDMLAVGNTDAELRFMIDHGGFIGFSAYPSFLPKGCEGTVDDCVAAMEHVVNVVGEPWCRNRASSW